MPGLIKPGVPDHEAQLVGVAGHPPVGLGEAVQGRTLDLALHALPVGVEAGEIPLTAGQGGEGVGPARHPLEIAIASRMPDHLLYHGRLLG